MAIWTMILRKMAKNKWLQLNLWFGLTLCVALFSSMPLYSEAILQRTLVKELQSIQYREAVYPGYVRISTSVSAVEMDDQTKKKISQADRFVQLIPERIGLDALSFYQQRSTLKLKVYGADASEQEIKSQRTTGSFQSLSSLDKRVRIIDGRMPADRTDGVFEALVTQKFLLGAKRDLGEELIAQSPENEQTRFQVIPVGIIQTDPSADPYLPYMTEEYTDGFIIPYEQFEREFTQGGKLSVANLEWRYALKYDSLSVDNMDQFVSTDRDIRRYFKGRLGVSEINIPATETIVSYSGIQSKLDLMMLSLYSPVVLMLVFYLYMAANLIIEKQKTEISVLRSRGASRLQIMAAYTTESLILGICALAAGPFLGVTFTKVLGASSGFLEFVQRSVLEVSLGSGAYKIAAAAVGGAILLILIPAFLATRTSIVGHKQQSARLNKMSFWHKTGLDVLLISLALYLLYNFNKRREDLQRLALDSDSLQVDPLLFLMPAVFALGSGLLVLRIYPYLVQLLFWAGRRWWPPALYHSLVQISRSSGQYLTIKVFLIMTVATGLFSANAARTINENMESKIQYAIGADMALMTRWASNKLPSSSLSATNELSENEFADMKRIQYIEPPFEPLQELEGVASHAKVFRKEGAQFVNGKEGTTGKTTLMGINTKDFGETAWMKDGLLNYHMNSYLNLLASNPNAVLISRSIADAAKVKPGDPIRINWEGHDQVQFTVYGIIDYWPTWNPLPSGKSEGNDGIEKPHLIVGHLSTIQNRIALEPYEIWLNLNENATSQQIYEQLAEQKISIVSFKDSRQQLIDSKNDPFRLAINGVMTLGFAISMLISFFGFLLFWILTFAGRTLQYGVLRAMGIPFLQIIGMLVSEQALTSGAAVIIGVLIGNLTSDLYVPLFEMSFVTKEQVPPFEIVRQLSDYLQLYSIVGATLFVGLFILGYRLARTRVAQALKLGEE
ncbi:FtsX-like permease family protein [Paenibacillus sp. LHD-117]|uniref:ABC transporter permease n=1 Tax=Paenibacillus sp. LHD-117 TaxID=3071412 RepID=UPI0027DF7237|nr:FtsX-like permease family protein [Paenibacillus sp. LHD-117]MDQ6417861.1 FtsX-like permease family protein [Paenibacillus sp. LHD-117]